MKIIIIAALLSLSACSSIGTLMSGMGQGLTSNKDVAMNCQTFNAGQTYQCRN